MTRLTLGQADTIIDRVLGERRDAGAKPLAVAVLDESGNLKAL